MGEVKYFQMGRIYAENIIKAIEKLGAGVTSIKPCLVQIKPGFVWYEYVIEVDGGGEWADGSSYTEK